ncbi:MAG: WecB/TagA/CpsF family glycosyltransferase [bacterium]
MPDTLPTRSLFGLDVCRITRDELVDWVFERAKREEFTRIAAFNTNKLYQIRNNELLERSMRNTEVVIPDGQSMVLASRLLPGESIPERLTGIDLFTRLVEECEAREYRPFFFGAEKRVLGKMLATFEERFPRLQVAGARHGYFNEEELPGIIDDINQSDPDMLFIGIPSPLKEEIMHQFGDDLEVPVVQGVGGSFDVLAGKVNRAPQWIQDAGFEWLYRLYKEPRRLGKRYAEANTYFAYRLLKEYFSQKTHSKDT